MAAGGNKKDLSGNIARLEAELQRDPGADNFHLLADAYTRAGQLVDAIKVCRDGLKRHPRHVPGHVALGRALFGSGNLPVAAKILHRTLALEGVDGEAYRLLGEVLLRMSMPDEAVRLMEQAARAGFADRPLRLLLKKARGASRQARPAADAAVAADADGDRGLGNVAVSGTINTSEAEDGETIPVRALLDGGIDEIQGWAVVDRAPGVRRGASPRIKTDLSLRRLPLEIFRGEAADAQPGWSSIDEAWERTLDTIPLGSEQVSKTPTPGFQRVDLPLSPLADPLAEGMPPLPQEPSSGSLSCAALAARRDRTEPSAATEPPTPLLDQAPSAPAEEPSTPQLEDRDLAPTEDLPGGAAVDHLATRAFPAGSAQAELSVAEQDQALPPTTDLAEDDLPPTAAAPGVTVALPGSDAATSPQLARVGEEMIEDEYQHPALAPLDSEPATPEPDDDPGALDELIEDALEDPAGQDHALTVQPEDEPEEAPTIKFTRVPEDELFVEPAAAPESATWPVAQPTRPGRGPRKTTLLLLGGLLLLFVAGSVVGWYLFGAG